jgi:hypothetical protein
MFGAAFAATLACSPSKPATSPETTLRDYAAAVRAGDATTAYALLSDEAKKRMSFEAFDAMLKEHPEDLEELANALARPGETKVTATVTTPEGDSQRLVLEDGKWRADLSIVDLYSQATPITALRSFVRAFRAGRYDILMRFAPVAHQDGLSEALLKQAWEGEQKEEMQQLVAALDASLPTAQAEVVQDRATVAYGAAGSVQLLLEDGLWKIEEF